MTNEMMNRQMMYWSPCGFLRQSSTFVQYSRTDFEMLKINIQVDEHELCSLYRIL